MARSRAIFTKLRGQVATSEAEICNPLFLTAFPTGSGGNSFVHSLLVTLSNHAVLGSEPYNEPCPKTIFQRCLALPKGVSRY